MAHLINTSIFARSIEIHFHWIMCYKTRFPVNKTHTSWILYRTSSLLVSKEQISSHLCIPYYSKSRYSQRTPFIRFVKVTRALVKMNGTFHKACIAFKKLSYEYLPSWPSVDYTQISSISWKILVLSITHQVNHPYLVEDTCS